MSLVPSKKEGGRKKSEFKCCGLQGPHVKGCFSSRAACVWLGKWKEGGGLLKKEKKKKLLL